ncbi:MAG: SDR family NAD(P)-dependent oxidoreductase [Bacteroidota bacterium]
MNISSKLQRRTSAKYGEWAVITGASSGIGKELSYAVAACGLNIVLIARDQVRLELVKEEVENSYHTKVEVVKADLAENYMDLLFDSFKDKTIGLFVASAGFGTSGNFIDNSVHEELNMLDVNCRALLRLTHHFAQLFAGQNRGGIILLSSIVAFQGVPYSANYAATKAYVQSLAEGLYHELKPHGVDVLSAAPGPVETGFGTRANMNMGNAMKPDQIAIPILKALGKKSTVLPGLLSKVLVYSLRTVPRWGKIRIMKLVMKGMTRHEH